MSVYDDMVGSNYSIICCDASFLTTVERVQWGEWRLATDFLVYLWADLIGMAFA